MIEKSSSIVLTSDDIEKYNAGIVSDRVFQNWGLSFEDLKQVIESKQFTRTKDV